METNSKIVIVGAGLAGLTAAIHLSKLGYSIILIEKNSFPKHKVCGEYISNEVLPYLDWLGVNPEILKPTKIDSLLFSTTKGKIIKAKLPLGGFGISRYAFDYYLFEKAKAQNCEIIQETVTDIHFSEDVFTVHLSNNTTLIADIVIGAYGKRSNIDQKLQRIFIQKKSPWLAVKAHYKGDFPNNLVGLHNFKGGYCGVSKVENDVINICYLANYETFQQYKNIEEYQSKVVAKNPLLQSIFENTVPLFEKPFTISQICFDKKEPVDQHILMIGDSAGLIHPLCGNGMAMAIRSAKIVSELVDGYCQNSIHSRKELEQKYTQKWNKNFKSRLRIGRTLGSILQHQNLSEWLIRIFIQFPILLSEVIKRTHGKEIQIKP
jgi:flavin-dependent dehydrogenase